MTVIAIDGPAGAGKSSVGRAVAEALGYSYVDTGSMYRRVALALQDRGIDLGDRTAVEGTAPALLATLNLEAPEPDQSDRLRHPASGNAASVIARYPGVRQALAQRQRALAETSDVVMEGRDIGTVVAPHAEVKIYLTASRSVRARRRQRQLGLSEDADTLRSMEDDLAARDRIDSARTDSPLRPAEDAVQIDSTDRNLDAVVGEVLKLVDQRLRRR